MSAVAEASALLWEIAEPRPVGDTIKKAVNRVAQRVTKYLPPKQVMTPGRAEDIWRKEARLIRAEEMDAIRKAADARIVREAKVERSKLEDRVARLEAALFIQDADFHQPSLDALRGMAGREDRALDRGGVGDE